jgi:hypothetical protein
VPTGVQLLIVGGLGVILLSIAIRQFQKVE